VVVNPNGSGGAAASASSQSMSAAARAASIRSPCRWSRSRAVAGSGEAMDVSIADVIAASRPDHSSRSLAITVSDANPGSDTLTSTRSIDSSHGSPLGAFRPCSHASASARPASVRLCSGRPSSVRPAGPMRRRSESRSIVPYVWPTFTERRRPVRAASSL
jgi:hypothetical protein